MVTIISAAKTGLYVTRTIVSDVSRQTRILGEKMFTTLVIETTENNKMPILDTNIDCMMFRIIILLLFTGDAFAKKAQNEGARSKTIKLI